MRNRTADKTTSNPVRALSLSVFFAGTLLVTSVASVAAMPMAPEAANASSWVDGLPLRVDPLPHQVAPQEGLDDIVLASRIDPLTFRNDSGVPHQVAPFGGLDDIVPATQIAPPTSRSDSGVPHQVAPQEGLDDIVLASRIDPLTSGSQAWSDRLNAQAAALGSQTLRSDSGVPHQVAPEEGLGG